MTRSILNTCTISELSVEHCLLLIILKKLIELHGRTNILDLFLFTLLITGKIVKKIKKSEKYFKLQVHLS